MSEQERKPLPDLPDVWFAGFNSYFSGIPDLKDYTDNERQWGGLGYNYARWLDAHTDIAEEFRFEHAE